MYTYLYCRIRCMTAAAAAAAAAAPAAAAAVAMVSQEVTLSEAMVLIMVILENDGFGTRRFNAKCVNKCVMFKKYMSRKNQLTVVYWRHMVT